MPADDVAMVKARIGGSRVVDVTPQHLQDFSYTRVTSNAANTLELSLFDETALELESLLTREKNRDELYFSYGWSGGEFSDTYNCFILDYDFTFESQGATLNIQAISKGAHNHSVPKIKYRAEGGTINPAKVVRTMIEENDNWIEGIIVPTKDVASDKDFHQINVADTQFIIDHLAPIAETSKDGISGYKFWFKDKPKGIEINFAPPTYMRSDSDLGVIKFKWKSPDSEVISFSPDYSGNLFLGQGANNVSAVGFDQDSNDMKSYNKTPDHNDRKLLAQSHYYADNGQKIVTNVSSFSDDEIDKYTNSILIRNMNMTYPATLEIKGRPRLNPHTTITILVFLPSGNLHHSSGTYYVKEITDNINGGFLTSTLQLFRNSGRVGDRKISGRKAGGR